MKNKNISLTLITAGGVLLTVLMIYVAQYLINISDFDQTARLFLDQVESSLNEKDQMVDSMIDYSRTTNQKLLWQIAYLLDDQDYKTMTSEERAASSLDYQKKAETGDIDLLLAIDQNGRIWQSSDITQLDKSITEEKLLTDGQLEKLLADASLDNEYIPGFDQEKAESPERGLYVELEETEYYCHATPLYDADNGSTYCLVSFSQIPVSVKSYSMLTDVSMYFKPIVEYDQIQAIGVETDTGRICFVSSGLEDYLQRSVADLGITAEELSPCADGEEHRHVIDGKIARFYARSYASQAIGNYTILVWQDGSLLDLLLLVAWPSLAALAILLAACISGILLKGCGKEVMLRKMRVFVLVGVILVTGTTAYVRAMTDISHAMEQSLVNAETFDSYYELFDGMEETVESYFVNKQISVLKMAAEYMEVNRGEQSGNAENFHAHAVRGEDGTQTRVLDYYGNELTSEADNELLKLLAEQTGSDSLYLLNSEGKTIAASNENWWYDLNYIAEEGGTEIFKVLDRKEPSYSLIITSENSPDYTLLAVPTYYYTKLDDSGNTVYTGKREYLKACEAGEEGIRRQEGVLVAEITSETGKSFLVDSSHFSTALLDSLSAAQNTEIALAMGSGEPWIYYRTANYPEIALADLKLKEADFENDNYRFIRTDAGKRFEAAVPVASVNDSCLVTLFGYEELFAGFWYLIFAAGFAIFLPLLLLQHFFVSHEEEKVQEEKTDLRGLVPITEKQAVNSAWETMNEIRKGRQRHTALKTAAVLLFVGMILAILIISGNRRDSLAFLYTLSLHWDRELHVFSVSYTCFLLITVTLSVKAVRRLLGYVTTALSAQSETFVYLILSVLQYAAVIVVIFYSLTLFGVEMGTVVTSGVILSAVIGLGANSLIGDVLAGLMIILEREFRVGDIVTINGFTGTVTEISLRTTKVQDSNRNVKTFNNSKIIDVLNLSDKDSKCFVTVDIPQTVPVEKIECLISEELKKALSGNKMILEGPWFSGIVGMSKGSYKVSIGVRCLQKNQWKVQKDLYGKLMVVLTEAGIMV